MFTYILKRLLYVVPIALAVSAVCFSLVFLAPGDPLSAILPPDATNELIEKLKADYGFDKPLPEQFGKWVWRAAQGDLGTSIATGRPVNSEIARAISNTFMLAMFACLVIASGMALDQRFPEAFPAPVSRLFAVALGALAFAHLATFVWVLRRYVIGAGSWVNMVRDATWQPPLTWIGHTVLFGLTLGAGAWILLRDNERQNRVAEARPAPQLD